MSTDQFIFIWLGTLVVIASCRILPALVLRGRSLPPRVIEALGYIPPAAFSALVVNDLFSPASFAIGAWWGLLPFVAAAAVVATYWKTRSMLWCCIVGVGSYVLLTLI